MKNNFPSYSRKGFTLVEMLVTITIIVILAGLSLGGYNYVNAKQARSKAEIQIKLLENGLEEYKFENGDYPDSTGASSDLYEALYWDTDLDGDGADTDDDQKIFVADLNPDANGQGWTNGEGATATIEDPWGNEYIYVAPGVNNPDFDLHSMGPDGQSDTEDDITNY
ncbi:type II secretion system protein GspG [Luteolibacter sp. AS25]|uniref:type II secretion system protein GspG n=1 Tax=Luteolibacter sp. AS25 TaxID=3135776 RepID=UPI00398A5B07